MELLAAGQAIRWVTYIGTTFNLATLAVAPNIFTEEKNEACGRG